MALNLASGLHLLADKAQKDLSNRHSLLRKKAQTIESSLLQISRISRAHVPLKKAFSPASTEGNLDPWGFYYGEEELSSIVNPKSRIYIPLLYSFQQYSATAIELTDNNTFSLLNFALRAIASYPIGLSCVYMIDADISGDFNKLSPISTSLDEQDNPKNFVHYISTHSEQQKLLDLLEERINNNITSYVSRYQSLHEYNSATPNMSEPYHFVFINDISRALRDIDMSRIQRMIYKDNATKAGVYFFFSYDKESLCADRKTVYGKTTELEALLEQSNQLDFSGTKFDGARIEYETCATSEEIDAVIKWFKDSTITASFLDFKEEIERTLSKGRLWQKLPSNYDYGHISIPVGLDASKSMKILHLSYNGTPYVPHMFIGGKTGSGKTILLHNIILNAALRFSPQILRFYLVDMKAGVSLLPYKDLPHAEIVSASSDRLYALTVLERSIQESEQRGGIFKQLGVTNISEANKILSQLKQELLPIIIVVIDEFQELVKGTDTIATEATKIIEKIHKKGRSQGVFLVLCTQSLGGVQTDISQVGAKLSLITNAGDSLKLLGNEAASKLGGKKGRAILNISEAGEERYNEIFQVAYIDETKDLPRYIQQIKQCYEKQGGSPISSLLFNEQDLTTCLSEATQKSAQSTHQMYVGMPMFCRKEHCSFSFHRDSKSNVIIVGNDRQTAMRLIGSITLQFINSYPNSLSIISDMQSQSAPTYNCLAPLNSLQEIRIHSDTEFEETLVAVHKELEERKTNYSEVYKAPEFLFSIVDLRPNPVLRIKHSVFGSSSAEPTALQRLLDILEFGPELGIHTIIYSHSMTNLQGVHEQISSGYAEIKIALRGGDSTRLLTGYGQGDAVSATGQAKLITLLKWG